MKCKNCGFWKGIRGDKHCVCVESVKPCELERNERKRKALSKKKLEMYGESVGKMRLYPFQY